MENKERGAILSGKPISDEIVLSIPMRYNPEPSVLVGETICENVASFYNDILPLELMDYYAALLTAGPTDEDDYFDEEEL